ncbi:dTDP-4-dehydrorhamnose reductase [Enterobacter roggenkampii]|nr:dTDP-4-dehydrorhamnose reductase [Enterobacter roggenkampii]MDK4549314.1 dTDP-4-dehydrorhamnose reductase [Enterobacter roggenkampii]
MKILLIGKNGQVGWELQRSLSTIGNVIAIDYSTENLCGDLRDLEGIARTIHVCKPDIVVNAAAYTAVDKAETNYDLCEVINAQAVKVLAKETSAIGALLVHYSTDYVFDGRGEHFRFEDDATAPLSAYGRTKLSGEEAIRSYNSRHLIFRTSWVYAARGNNFLKTMLKLGCEKEKLSVINDQHGAPTSAELLADCTAIAIRKVIENPTLTGTYHLVASGETTWYDYALKIFEIAIKHGIPLKVSQVNGIPTEAYPTSAKRPKNSRLSNMKFQNAFDVVIPNWEVNVERTLIELISK